jgi:uncharacterized membrane protein
MSKPDWDPDQEYRVDRWPASLAILACVALYVVLPDSLVVKPHWLIPALVLVLLIPLALTHRYRHPGEPRWTRPVSISVLALINLANILSVVFLIHRQFWGTTSGTQTGRTLFFSAIVIWVTNVIVFGLWYWELDRGGPSVRGSIHENWPDFQFPQMENPKLAKPDWHPSFYDYLYLAFTDASAFSPTDAMPLSRTAKALMTIESAVSMLTIIVVAARAINILH